MFKSQFLGKFQETPTDWSFRFSIPEGFHYVAGQYSVIRLELAYPDTLNNSRTCSLSSSPTEPYLQFTFTIRDTGFKKTLMEMEVGTEVDLFRVRGKMTLEYVPTPHCVMIAGGIGIAPFRGIIKYAFDTRLDRKLSLVYSDKTIAELAYYTELKDIELKNENFQAFYTLTRHSEDHGEWSARQGRIDASFISEIVSDFSGCTFMVCGPVEMAQSTIQHLYSLGVPREQILAELFTGY